MPSIKQLEKMAAALGGKAPAASALTPDDDLPPEYCQALLEDAGTEIKPTGPSMAALQLTEISQQLLGAGCKRCRRTVEIQKIDAIRSTAKTPYERLLTC